MDLRVGILVAVASCGRLDFEPQAINTIDDAAIDTPADTITQVIPPGARIWLRAETNPNGGIVDSAGGHAAGCVGACPALVAGVHGNGYAFAMNEIDIQDAADLDSSAGFTGAVWVNLTSLPTSLACVWSKPFNSASGFDTFTLCIDPGGTTVFDCESPTGVGDAETGPVIAPGAWHHLAMTWDGVTKRSFLDGTQVAAKDFQIGHGTEPATLGAEVSAFYTQAIVDDVLYYTRALTASEINELATP